MRELSRAVKGSLELRFAPAAFGTLGTCGEWGWSPDTRGVSLGGDLSTHTLLLSSGYYMRREVCDTPTRYSHPEYWSSGSRHASLSPSYWNLLLSGEERSVHLSARRRGNLSVN